MGSSRRGRSRAASLAVVMTLLVTACGGSTAPTGGPGGATLGPAASGPATSGKPTGPATGPSGSPGASEPGAPLPVPTLTDPVEIGKALWDPNRVDQGVVSLIEQLGVPIYAADGSRLRSASRPGPPGLWLDEGEVRWLIEMGREDAAAIADHKSPFTLHDLSAALASLLPSMSEQEILDAYIAAYRPVPGDLVRESLAGHAFLRDTPFTRVHLWLLLVDGVIGRLPRSSAAAGSSVSLVAWPRTAAAPVATVNLPPIPSPIANLTALDFAFLLTQAPLLGSRIQVDFSITPSQAHEGHGQAGPVVAIEARNRSVPTPLVSPFLGTVLLAPRAIGLDGVPVTFESSDAATLDEHGTLQGFLGVPITTDALGLARLEYDVRQEPGAGQGQVQSTAVQLRAVIDLRMALTSQYAVDPLVLTFVWGTRVLPDVLALEWHEASIAGDYLVTLAGKHVGAGQYAGHAEIYCTETPNGSGGSTWSVISQPRSGGLTDFEMGEVPDYLSAEVSSQTEFDPWRADSRSPADTATVTAFRVGDLVHVQGHGSHADSTGAKYTIEITVTCAPLE